MLYTSHPYSIVACTSTRDNADKRMLRSAALTLCRTSPPYPPGVHPVSLV